MNKIRETKKIMKKIGKSLKNRANNPDDYERIIVQTQHSTKDVERCVIPKEVFEEYMKESVVREMAEKLKDYVKIDNDSDFGFSKFRLEIFVKKAK